MWHSGVKDLALLLLRLWLLLMPGGCLAWELLLAMGVPPQKKEKKRNVGKMIIIQ